MPSRSLRDQLPTAIDQISRQAAINARILSQRLDQAVIMSTQFTGSASVSIQNALNYAGGLTNGGTVIVPYGQYNVGSTQLIVPNKVNLLLDNSNIISSAEHAINISLGSDSNSGNLIGTGHASTINHSGTGHAVACVGAGESRANAFIENLRIIGTASGEAGIYSSVLNRLTMNNVKVSNYTAGHGWLNEGGNAITLKSCSYEGNLHGVTHKSITRFSNTYSANAIMAFGSHFVGNTGWGWQELSAGGSTPNAANALIASTFENNGTNLSSTTGHIYAEYSDSLSILDSYFEDYSGTAPNTAILIGATGIQSQAVLIRGNFFATSGTNVIDSNNGQSVWVYNNLASGAGTNFVYNGANARGLVVLQNRAPARTNHVAGFDNGADTITDQGNFTNASSATIRGVGFNSISGLAQDLVLRTRGGGTNCVVFQAADGTTVGSVSDSGVINTASQYNVNGSKVVGSRVTGFGAMTGIADKTAIATYNAPDIDVTYNEAQIQALADAVQANSRRLKAIDDSLIAHGLNGA